MIKKSLLFITCIFVNLAAMEPAAVDGNNPEAGQRARVSQIHPETGLPMPDPSAFNPSDLDPSDLRPTGRVPRPNPGRQIRERLYEIDRNQMQNQEAKYSLMRELHKRAVHHPGVRKNIYRKAIQYAPNKARIMAISRDGVTPLAARIADLEALRGQVDDLEKILIRDQISKLRITQERIEAARNVQQILRRRALAAQLEDTDMEAVARGMEMLSVAEVRNIQADIQRADAENDINSLEDAIRNLTLDRSEGRPGSRPHRRQDRSGGGFPRRRPNH